jgi:hypothetical protein
LFAAWLTLLAGRFLFRRLGFPGEPAKALGWGLAILACALALATLLDEQSGRRLGGTSGIGLGDALLILNVAALAIIGRAWTRAHFGERKQDRKPKQVRRRALPPAPNFPQNPNDDPPDA